MSEQEQEQAQAQAQEQAQVRERRRRQSVRAGEADVGLGPGTLCVVRTGWTGMLFGLGLSAVREHRHWQVGNLKNQCGYYQMHDSVARALSAAECTHVGELLCRD